ncbi:Hsp20 family protein [Luteithermobacter gelatinilyticus]|uniref:Hsp20 family protein n=1 Tax=Luteithermobacter gelatinilyticus TaxID=2582913 RepID=UPI0011071484|nr:Hsp20 family protein [Luteithermobacter gelatinilyticus]
MRTPDLTPLMRSTIGFDHINRMFENLNNLNKEVTYPPYDIEKVSEDAYRITMALAGFTEDELDVSIQEGVLVISGKSGEEDEEAAERYLYRGIAKRAFERRFKLADTIRVLGATFENGLLVIDLEREVPEHLKPRKIEINKTGKKVKTISDKAA